MPPIKTLAGESIFWPSYSLKPFFLFSKTLLQTLAHFLQIKNLSVVSSKVETIFQNWFLKTFFN